MKNYCKYVLAVLTLGFALSTVSAQVVINEIMYHPLSDQSADEYVEVYNSGAGTVDISGWCFDGINFCFPGATTIDPGQYLVVSKDAAQFQSTYGAPPDFEFATLPDTVLNDGGERLAAYHRAMTTHEETNENESRPRELPAQAEVVDASDPIETQEEGGTFITEPSKLIRIASMTRAMLEEVRQAEVDELGRRRLAEIYTNSMEQLRESLSDDLQEELDSIFQPLHKEDTSGSELRIVQAQLGHQPLGVLRGERQRRLDLHRVWFCH